MTLVLLLATLYGRVVSCTGDVLPGAIVTTEAGARQITAADGRFRFEVPAGSVTLSAELSGFEPLRKTFAIADGKDAEMELVLPMHVIDDCIPVGGQKLPTHRRFHGRVTTLRGEPLRSAAIRLTSEQSTQWRMKSDRRGRFRTPELPVGQYILEVSAPGYRTQSLPVWTSACTEACERPFVLRLSPQ